MLTYSFEEAGKESLYLYLYKCIRDDILSGKLKPDEKLPSKRSFAKNLGVSTITVENAYAQLVAEGYLYTVPKSGFYVEKISNSMIPPIREKPKSFFAQQKEPAQEHYQWDFAGSHTNPDHFPFTIWARLMRDEISINQKNLMKNPPGGGVEELRMAIAYYLYQFQGFYVTPEQIVVGAGTEYLYGLIIALLGGDKIYALEDPGYPKVAQIYESHQVNPHFIGMDEGGINMEELRKSNAQVAHVTPSHHYPTGITMPIGRRYELLNWVSEEDRYIIEDDYDCEFRLAGKPIPPLMSIDHSNRVIYMNTFTKSLASTIRISYMVLPLPLLTVYKEKLGFFACTVSNFEQYTLARFIEGGYFDKHINRMRNEYRKRRDALIKQIKESKLNAHVKISSYDAGLHFILSVNTSLSDEELMQKAANKHIRIICLSKYYHNESQKQKNLHKVMMNFTSVAVTDMKAAVEDLNEAWFPDKTKCR